MIDLSPHQKNTVLDIAKKTFPNSAIEVFIFGSRAKNTARKYSDLDIAIKSEEKISPSKLQDLKYSYSQSNLPFMVDVIDLNSISTEFYQAIQNDLILLAD